VLLLETHPSGWWYSAPAGPAALVVTLVTDANVLRAGEGTRESVWDYALSTTPHTQRRAATFAAASWLPGRPLSVAHLEHVAGDGLVAIGDAASTYDPLSGIGIRKALIDAERAAAAIHRAFRGEPDALAEYASGVGRAFRRHVVERGDYYGREQRWSNSPFWTGRSVGARAPSG
jgi:flavin-dependent dehydrogenase